MEDCAAVFGTSWTGDAAAGKGNDQSEQIEDQACHQAPSHLGKERILQLIAKGSSNKDIAAVLFISIKTVKTHITHIFEKLEVSDRTEAVTKAFKMGLLKIE